MSAQTIAKFRLKLKKVGKTTRPFTGSWKKQGNSRKNICFVDYAKAFDCVDHNKLWKILQEMGKQTTLPASWETCMQVKKQQLEPDTEQQTGSKLGKEYIKAVHTEPTL